MRWQPGWRWRPGRAAAPGPAVSAPAAPALRLLIVSAYALPHIGGVEVVIAQQARALAALGYQVTVVTSRCARGARSEQVDGYRVLRVPAWNGLEDRAGLPLPVWTPAALWRLGGLVRQADVVHVQDPYHLFCLLAAVLTRLRRRPVFTSQNVSLVGHRPVVEMAQRAVNATGGRLVWALSEEVICFNPSVSDFLRRRGVPAARVKTIGNGVDTDFFSPGTAAQRAATRARYGLDPQLPLVLFVGRLVPKKGAEILAAASSPHYQVALAGPGAVPGRPAAGVRFLGPATREQLRDLYRCADVFAFPATGEIFTLVMQEAMACGLPVVATADASYARYQLDPESITLIPAQAGAFRSALTAVAADPARRARMGAWSRKMACAEFDSRHYAAALAADYARACHRATGGGPGSQAPAGQAPSAGAMA